MDDSKTSALGAELYAALAASNAVQPLSERYPDLDIDAAYAIQQELLKLRLKAGECVIGKKVGVTSRAVMDMLGVQQPDFGWLTDAMLVADGAGVQASRFIQPKAEGEVAFVLERSLRGPGVTPAEVLASTRGVMPSIEIVDSRIEDWRIKITDTVADNASCGAFVLGGELVDVRDVDLGTCGMVLEKNGEVVATGSGAAALGAPANAVAWLANTLGAMDVALEAGEVVLSGSLAAMTPVLAGDNVRVTIGGVGACSVRFE